MLPGFIPIFNVHVFNWQTESSAVLNTNVAGQANITRREQIPTSAYLLGTKDGAYIRITLSPVTAGNTAVFGPCYVGHAGASPPNFDGGQVQLFFAGSTTVTLTAGGADVVSDPIPFKFDHTKSLLVSFATAAANVDVHYNAALATYTDYSKTGDNANVGSTVVSGYASAAQLVTVSKVEISP